MLIAFTAIMMLACVSAPAKVTPKAQPDDKQTLFKEEFAAVDSQRYLELEIIPPATSNRFLSLFEDSTYASLDSVAVVTWEELRTACEMNELDRATYICVDHKGDLMQYCLVSHNIYKFFHTVAFPLYKLFLPEQEAQNEIINTLEIINAIYTLQIQIRKDGEAPPHYLDLITEMILAYINDQDYGNAEKICDQYTNYVKLKDGTNSYQYALSLSNKGYINIQANKLNQAAKALRQSISVFNKIGESDCELCQVTMQKLKEVDSLKKL